MKLIQEIINDLTSSDKNIVDALLKTKVIAFKLKNQELLNWVNNEFNGYENGNDLPDYRVIGCVIYGTVSNGFGMMKNYPIPVYGLEKKDREMLTTIRMAHSISAIYDLATRQNETIGRDIPPELYYLFNRSLSDGYEVIHARSRTDQAQLVQIISTVRSKLLDFMLSLQNEIGYDTEDLGNDKEILQKASELFTSTIFGNNTTNIIGSHNSQETQNKGV